MHLVLKIRSRINIVSSNAHNCTHSSNETDSSWNQEPTKNRYYIRLVLLLLQLEVNRCECISWSCRIGLLLTSSPPRTQNFQWWWNEMQCGAVSLVYTYRIQPVQSTNNINLRIERTTDKYLGKCDTLAWVIMRISIQLAWLSSVTKRNFIKLLIAFENASRPASKQKMKNISISRKCGMYINIWKKRRKCVMPST